MSRRWLLAGALALGCQGPARLIVRPVPGSCPPPGVERVVITALGDFSAEPPLSTTVKVDAMGQLLTVPQLAHMVALEGLDASGAVLAIGRSVPFSFGRGVNGLLAVAWAAPDRPCATGSLIVPRAGHRATLLPSGALLLSGGRGMAGPVTALELYDPSSGAFARGGELPGEMAIGHTVSRLDSGLVLFAGGSSGSGAASRRLVTSAADGTDPHPGPELAAARAHHAASPLPNGTLLLVGGCAAIEGDDCTPGARLAATEIFDPVARTLRPGPALTRPRSHHAAIPRSDGTVLVVGGRIDGGEAIDAEVLDPTMGRRLPSGGSVGGAVPVAVGGVAVAGGERLASARVALLAAGAVVTVGQLAEPRRRPLVVAFEDGDVLVVGGFGADGRASGAVDLLAGSTAVTTVRALPRGPARAEGTATLLGDGTLLVAGGVDEAGLPRGDSQRWVHSLLGPYTDLPRQGFADAASARLSPLRPDRTRLEAGRLVLAAPPLADVTALAPLADLALLPAAAFYTADVEVAAGRGRDGAGVAIVFGWAGDADYQLVRFAPGQPLQVVRVAAQVPGKVEAFADGRCVGAVLSPELLPAASTAPLRVWVRGATVQVFAGDRLLLDCSPSTPVARGTVGVGSLGGEALFDDLRVQRR